MSLDDVRQHRDLRGRRHLLNAPLKNWEEGVAP
jgi:hypothetical protein